MKLTSMVTRSGGASKLDAGERADVGLFERDDLRSPAQARVQLPAADIDRIDPLRAALEQHLREAAGRGADVEADAALSDRSAKWSSAAASFTPPRET